MAFLFSPFFPLKSLWSRQVFLKYKRNLVKALSATFYWTPVPKHLLVANMTLGAILGELFLEHKWVRPSNIKEGNRSVDKPESSDLSVCLWGQGKVSLTNFGKRRRSYKRKYRYEEDNIFLWFKEYFSLCTLTVSENLSQFHSVDSFMYSANLHWGENSLSDVLYLGRFFHVLWKLD